jgi:hypothetical protein
MYPRWYQGIVRWRNGKHFKESRGRIRKVYHGLTIVSPAGRTSVRLTWWGMVGRAVLLWGATKVVSLGETPARLTGYSMVSSKVLLQGGTVGRVLGWDFSAANQVDHGW